MSHNGKTTVAPKLAFSPESMRSASSSDNLSGSDWTYLWNRSQQFNRSVSLSFREDRCFRPLPKLADVI